MLRASFGSGIIVVFVNVHLPSYTDTRMVTVMAELHSLLTKHRFSRNVAVLGDFNAHIGINDLIGAERGFIGRTLFHDLCNENGSMLKSLIAQHFLIAINTYSTSSTVKTTWRRRDSVSQIDHILCRFAEDGDGVVIQNIRAVFSVLHKSDHKLLFGKLVFGAPITSVVPRLPQHASRATSSSGSQVVAPDRTAVQAGLHYAFLMTEFGVKKYKIAIRLKMELFPVETSVPDRWNRIREVIGLAANEVLARSAPSSPRSRKALAEFKSARCKAARPPIGATVVETAALAHQLKITRKRLFDARQTHRSDECASFFERINDFHPQVRMNKTYGYVSFYEDVDVLRCFRICIFLGI